MKKALLIVDPQYDFITGSLPVPGAADAMDRLAQYMAEFAADYALVIITLDWHPIDHMSFSDRGGQWPVHCVRYSKGAAIWQPLYQAVQRLSAHLLIVTKGTDTEREEYSIFQNASSRERIIKSIEASGIQQIDICGLAGDICVHATLIDGIEIFGTEKFHLLKQFSPCINGE